MNQQPGNTSFGYVTDDFVIKQVIGVGAYAEVRIALKKSTQELVAIKIFDRTRGLEKSMNREIKWLQKLKHNGIVELKEVVETIIPTQSCLFCGCTAFRMSKDLDKHCQCNHKQCSHQQGEMKRVCLLVEELALGGELFSILCYTGPFPDELSRHYFQQLIDAVEEIHSLGLVHLDIKPENILFSSTFELKLCDFGLAVEVGEYDHEVEFTEYTPYVSPELVLNKEISPACDIWSCAIILFLMLAGKPPFRRPVHTSTRSVKSCKHFVKILNGIYPSVIKSSAQNLLQRMLLLQPSHRMTISDIRRHCWFLGDVPTFQTLQISMESRALSMYAAKEQHRLAKLLSISRLEGFPTTEASNTTLDQEFVGGESKFL